MACCGGDWQGVEIWLWNLKAAAQAFFQQTLSLTGAAAAAAEDAARQARQQQSY
jgi:hypothetical protein